VGFGVRPLDGRVDPDGVRVVAPRSVARDGVTQGGREERQREEDRRVHCVDVGGGDNGGWIEGVSNRALVTRSTWEAEGMDQREIWSVSRGGLTSDQVCDASRVIDA